MNPPATIRLREAGEGDLDFLYQVYASTRYEELAVTGWDQSRTESFLRSQFEAQDSHYHENYPEASFLVVDVDGRPAGRLYLFRAPTDLHILDIALLPEFRGHGTGSRLLTDIQEEARRDGKTVSIYVEKFNRALELYRRLGFEPAGDEGVYLGMIWRPESLPTRPTAP